MPSRTGILMSSRMASYGVFAALSSPLPRPRLVDAIPLVLEGHPDRLPDRGLVVDHQNSKRHN